MIPGARRAPPANASSPDYIRTYLGLLGSGKTTQALRDVEGRARVLVYSPGSTNPLMKAYPYIYDTPQYLKTLRKFMELHPRLRIEKRAAPSPLFRVLSTIKGYTIVLDDVAALKTEPQERSDFEGFLRTVRFNGNQLVITTHRARKDLPPLVHIIGTSFFYVGPGTRSKREVETLFELANYPISLEEFKRGLEENTPRDGQRPAGVFPIRRP